MKLTKQIARIILLSTCLHIDAMSYKVAALTTGAATVAAGTTLGLTCKSLLDEFKQVNPFNNPLKSKQEIQKEQKRLGIITVGGTICTGVLVGFSMFRKTPRGLLRHAQSSISQLKKETIFETFDISGKTARLKTHQWYDDQTQFFNDINKAYAQEHFPLLRAFNDIKALHEKSFAIVRLLEKANASPYVGEYVKSTCERHLSVFDGHYFMNIENFLFAIKKNPDFLKQSKGLQPKDVEVKRYSDRR